MSIVPISYDDKKAKYKMDCYILHTFKIISDIITIHYRYYLLSLRKKVGQNKKYWHINIIKIENNEF